MTSQKDSPTVWRLRKGMDRRFRAGHPWVYSNELAESPRGIEPGAGVELQDASGKFLARGYGNPNSLISFRTLSRNEKVLQPTSEDNLLSLLKKAESLRNSLGMTSVSHRICFGEGDFIPGLVMDRYILDSGQAFVIQAHTAGADRIASHILSLVERFVKGGCGNWEETSVILRNDLQVRKLEGLQVEEPQILRKISGTELKQVKILVQAALHNQPLLFQVDLVEGQKTGFFLDQYSNIQGAALRFQRMGIGRIKILDLCCYVGQWGAQLAKVFRDQGVQVEVTAVDVSETALHFAQANIEAQGVSCKLLKTDVLKNLSLLESESFDLVVSDPPALIKSRKDIPVGIHAYLQLATQVFRVVKKGGGVVCCSCSALLEEEEFLQVLSKAAFRNKVTVRWVGRGPQSPDHPMLAEFPEGRYLKGWFGFVEK